MKISVLIPTKNEPMINELIKRVHMALRNYKHEIIVVDKSTKKPKFSGARLIAQISDGLGGGIIEGFDYVCGDIVITMDGDFSHDPKDLPRFLKKIKEGYDVVVGSRYINGGRIVNWTISRKISSKVANNIARFLLGVSVHDITSNYRCYRKSVLDSINLKQIKSRGYAFIEEILYISKLKGFKIQEIPIVFVDRKLGKSKLTRREIYKFIFDLVKLKFSRIFSSND